MADADALIAVKDLTLAYGSYTVQQQLDFLCAVHNATDCPGGNMLWNGDDSMPASACTSTPTSARTSGVST